MSTGTVIIVVGGDYLAIEICTEILKTAGHAVVLLWRHDDDRAAAAFANDVERLSGEFGDAFRYVEEHPTTLGALHHAGLKPVREAGSQGYCVVAVAQDDRLNLRVALLARDLNENVRVTLRQFNPLLGHKIQEGLKHNCTAISPAAHAAATYAASAVDPSCFYALTIPTLESMLARVTHRREQGFETHGRDEDAQLFGFCERNAVGFGIAGATVEAAETTLGARIVAVNGGVPYLCRGAEATSEGLTRETRLQAQDRVVAFGPIAALKKSGPKAQERRASTGQGRLRREARHLLGSLLRVEPFLRTALGGAILLYVAFVAYFVLAMHWNVVATLYYVFTTMTTVGYGDISPCRDCATNPLTLQTIVPLLVAMLMMFAGVTFFAIFTAAVTSGLNAAALRRIRGLRRIYRRGHVIVCGAGNVGSLVIDYLRQLGEQVVVIEKNPDELLIEMARDRKIDLLTGDATNDEAIGFCSPETAKSLVGVTNSDTANLEAALGARSRVRRPGLGHLHSVLRIDDPSFGSSIQRHFGITSFSPTELTAPTIAGLARFESTRGRFDLFPKKPFQQTFQLAERFQGPENAPPPAPPERPGYQVRWIPLYAWRESGKGQGTAVPIHEFAGEVRPGDRLLFMVPMSQFADPE